MFQREVTENSRRVGEKEKNRMRSETLYFAVKHSIVLLHGSRASPLHPSNKVNMKVKMLEVSETAA
jgi:hypothetical protein